VLGIVDTKPPRLYFDWNYLAPGHTLERDVQDMPAKGYYEFEGTSPSGEGKATFRVAKDGILKHFMETGNSAVYGHRTE
jgi:hypothetical protein